MNNNHCSMSDGPFCYQISNEMMLKESDLLSETIKNISISKIEPSLEKIISELMINLEKFKNKFKASKTTQFKLAPKVLMNLLLNFESFDPQTMGKDVYMPEEKIINFNVGYLKINFKGKLRLSHDKASTYENPPAKTYGIIEERDLFIKFDKPIMLKYLYIRPHNPQKNLSQYTIEISGYRNEQMLFSVRESTFLSPKQWYKIIPPNKVIDTIKLPKDFDIDDIQIIHDSEFSDDNNSKEDLSNMIQGIIDELLNKKNKLNKDDY